MPESLVRTAHVGEQGINAEKRTVTFTAVSSDPIWRTWMGMEDFLEVIDLRRADLSWLKTGNAPVLFQHNSDMPIGRIVSAKLEKGEDRDTVVVKAQFYEDDEDSERAFRRISSGMMRNVSIGGQSSAKVMSGLSTESRIHQ